MFAFFPVINETHAHKKPCKWNFKFTYNIATQNNLLSLSGNLSSSQIVKSNSKSNITTKTHYACFTLSS